MEIFAHRGVHSNEVLENSARALEKIHDSKATGIEIDLRLTKDGVCVLNHGTKTDSRIRISRTKFQDLKSVHPELISIEEAMGILKGYRGKINLEIKHIFGERDRSLGNLCLEVLSENKSKLFTEFESQILISSFSKENLNTAANLFPEYDRALLIATTLNPTKSIKKAIKLGCEGIHFPLSHALKSDFISTVNKAQESGLKTRVYTLNLAHDMENVLRCSVDGIFTDNTELAYRVMKLRE